MQEDRGPLAGVEDASGQQLGWAYDSNRWVLTAFDHNGTPKPMTPLAPPKVPTRKMPGTRCSGHDNIGPIGLPTNRGYSAAANLYHLERVYMDETVPQRSKSSHGLFNRRVTPRRDILARHPKIDTLHRWGTIQQHNNWVTAASAPAAWATCGTSYTHEGRK